MTTTPVGMDPVAFRSYGDTIQPMLASPPKQGQVITAREFEGWIFDIKLDGIRALAHWDGDNLRLINRSGKDMTNRYPDLEMSAVAHGSPFQPGVPMILDGEIVALSGSFQDTQKRDKQNKPADVAAVLKSHPVNFIAFDVIFDVSDARTAPYYARRARLEQLFDQRPATNSAFAISVVSKDPGFFDIVKEKGMEGVIAKRPRSQYRAGRYTDWVKFKALRSITAIGLGYDKGEGARAHFGAMRLVLLDGDQVVEIGRVGTGFTKSTINMLKDELDAGRPVLCEIECLNKSKDGQLRFPVYKGLRTDLSVTDATIDQLADIPTM